MSQRAHQSDPPRWSARMSWKRDTILLPPKPRSTRDYIDMAITETPTVAGCDPDWCGCEEGFMSIENDTLEKLKRRPAYCLTCRVAEGAGSCAYCDEVWGRMMPSFRLALNALATSLPDDRPAGSPEAHA